MSYVPATNLYGMLSDLGDTISSGIKDYRKQQLISDLGKNLQDGDYTGAAQRAFQGGDLQTGMSLLKLGQGRADQAQAAKLLGMDPTAFGGGAASPSVGAAPQPAPSSGDMLGRARDAIASIESGGRYDALGPTTKTGDRAYGKYQVMGANIPVWTQQVLGRSMTPDEFLANPQAQDAVFNAKFGEAAQRGGPANAASVWFSGRPLAQAGNASDVLGTTVPSYVQKFMTAYNKGGGGSGTPQPASAYANGGVKVASSSDTTLPAAAAPSSDDGADSAKLTNLRNYQSGLIIKMASTKDDNVRAAMKAKLDVVEKMIKDATPDKEKWTPLPRKEYAKYGIPPDTPGPVLRNANGDVKAPLKAQTQVNIQQQAEKSYDVELSKTYAKNFSDYQEQGRNAAGELNTLRYMQKIVDSPSFYSGAAGPVVTQAKRALSSLGVTDTKDAAPNEVFEKLSNKLVLDGLGGSLGPGISNADRDFIQRTTANVGNTKEGNRRIIDVGMALAQRKQDIARLAREYAVQHNGRIDQGFDDRLAQWAEANPLFEQEAQPQAGPSQSEGSGAMPSLPAGWTVQVH